MIFASWFMRFRLCRLRFIRRMEDKLRVSSGDHVAVPPTGERGFVFGDDERYDVVSSLLISRVTVDREPSSAAQQ